jgi:hypothetical protein
MLSCRRQDAESRRSTCARCHIFPSLDTSSVAGVVTPADPLCANLDATTAADLGDAQVNGFEN